ncbi:MAG: hypothetical protein ACHQ5A_05000 [Opitutales bacterium]
MPNRHLLFLIAALPALLFARDQYPAAGEHPAAATAGSEHLLAPAAPLVAPETARAVVEKFKGAYEKLGRPRIVFSVDRERLAAEVTPALTLADRQTIRDVERLFGRPFRAAGVTLTDPVAAAPLLAGKPFRHFAAADNEQTRRQREALTRIADVVIEVLISTRPVPVPSAAGDQTLILPDIQATAIRLSNSALLGSAAARDLPGNGPEAAGGRPSDVNQIAEATALALMEDIAAGAK